MNKKKKINDLANCIETARCGTRGGNVRGPSRILRYKGTRAGVWIRPDPGRG